MATFALTDEQRDTFDRDGVVCLRGVMNEAEVGDL